MMRRRDNARRGGIHTEERLGVVDAVTNQVKPHDREKNKENEGKTRKTQVQQTTSPLLICHTRISQPSRTMPAATSLLSFCRMAALRRCCCAAVGFS